MLQQQPDQVLVAILGRVEEEDGLGLHVGTGRDQGARDLGVLGEVQRRSQRAPGVHIGAVGEQQLHQRTVEVEAREQERRPAVVRDGAGVGSGLEQQADDVVQAAFRRHQERGLAALPV